MAPTVRIAESDEDIRRCFAVMRQLRLDLIESEFVPRVRRQGQAGYRIAFVEDDGRVTAVAGYRYLESLSSGKFLYVDDLVTDENQRSKNYGKVIFDWLTAQAK